MKVAAQKTHFSVSDLFKECTSATMPVSGGRQAYIAFRSWEVLNANYSTILITYKDTDPTLIQGVNGMSEDPFTAFDLCRVH